MSDLKVIVGGRSSALASAPGAASLSGLRGGQGARLEPGTQLGNYLIVSRIAEGGMGVVYKAHDTVLDRAVALKILSPNLFRNRAALQRFRTEAKAQARLGGPNIAMLHSMFEAAGSLVLVMEFMDGQTLAARIRQEGCLSAATAVWVFEQVLLGVDRAHKAGIVHRDLKPSNLFLTRDHNVKLMDFGVARMVDRSNETEAGAMIGTLTYISPEQIRGEEADFRSDIYMLGASLYEAVTGQPPFRNKGDFELMQAHLSEVPRAPHTLNPDIPETMSLAIMQALEKEPGRRFQNAQAFRSAILKLGIIHVRTYRRIMAKREKDQALYAHYTHGAGTEAPRPGTPPVSLTARGRWVMGSALSALIALGIVMFMGLPQTGGVHTGMITPGSQRTTAAPVVKPVVSVVSEAGHAPVQGAPVHRTALAKKRAAKAVAEAATPAPDRYETLRRAWGG